ncbi:MAG: ABC transporter permease [Erysipelothrix sp.]|nr:ABC transporter permease [Erysipelothrix sp.]
MNKKRTFTFNLARAASAIGIAILVATFLIFVSSSGDTFSQKIVETLEALRAMLISPLFKTNGEFNLKGLYDILAGMIPIMFTGLATAVMFSANQFNLGAEGGIMLGAFVTALCGIYLPLPPVVLPVVSILIGSLATMLLLLIPAIFKAKLGVSEMVNSLMLNYIVMYGINFVLSTFLADKSKGQLQTLNIQAHASLPQLVGGGSKLSIGFIVAIITVVVISVLMYRTRWGYNIRMIGKNLDFSKYSGINVPFYIILSQALGGFLAGMGGSIEMLGRYNAYDWKSLPGYGWTGITVAILAGNNPKYVPLAAFFMAFLDKGCELMSTYSNVPAQLIDIIQAVIFLFFAAQNFLSRYRQKLVVQSAEEELLEKSTQMEGK